MTLFSSTLRAGVLAGAVLLALGMAGCSQSDAPVAAVAAVDAKHAYTIRGTLEGLKDGDEVTLLIPSLSEDVTTSAPAAKTVVRDGGFVLTGTVEQPVPGVLQLGKQGTAKVIVEAGELRVEQGPLGPLVKGGVYNDRVYGYLDNPEYVAAYKANREATRAAFANVDETDEVAMKAARESTVPAFTELSRVKNDYDHQLLDGDEPALLKLLVLSENYDWKRYDQARREQMQVEFAKTLGDHPVLRSMKHAAEEYKKSQQLAEKFGPGKPYADISGVDADGKEVKLSEVLARNKLVLLDFWASWCGPCRGEFPHLLKVYREFHPHGFEIFAVSLDEEKEEWVKAMHEEGGTNDLPWINLQAPGFEAPAAQTYGVGQLPQNYLISSDGTIVGVGMREWDVERAVRAQIKKTENAQAL